MFRFKDHCHPTMYASPQQAPARRSPTTDRPPPPAPLLRLFSELVSSYFRSLRRGFCSRLVGERRGLLAEVHRVGRRGVRLFDEHGRLDAGAVRAMTCFFFFFLAWSSTLVMRCGARGAMNPCVPAASTSINASFMAAKSLCLAVVQRCPGPYVCVEDL